MSGGVQELGWSAVDAAKNGLEAPAKPAPVAGKPAAKAVPAKGAPTVTGAGSSAAMQEELVTGISGTAQCAAILAHKAAVQRLTADLHQAVVISKQRLETALTTEAADVQRWKVYMTNINDSV